MEFSTRVSNINRLRISAIKTSHSAFLIDDSSQLCPVQGNELGQTLRIQSPRHGIRSPGYFVNCRNHIIM